MARTSLLLQAVAAAAAMSIAAAGRSKTDALVADDGLLRERRDREREAAKRERERQAAGTVEPAPKRQLTPADEERLRLAAERRSRKVARQARGFAPIQNAPRLIPSEASTSAPATDAK